MNSASRVQALSTSALKRLLKNAECYAGRPESRFHKAAVDLIPVLLAELLTRRDGTRSAKAMV